MNLVLNIPSVEVTINVWALVDFILDLWIGCVLYERKNRVLDYYNNKYIIL